MEQVVYVVTGSASQRPVAAFRDFHLLSHWLRMRRGTSMLIVRKMNGGAAPVVLCNGCVRRDQERGTHE